MDNPSPARININEFKVIDGVELFIQDGWTIAELREKQCIDLTGEVYPYELTMGGSGHKACCYKTKN